MADVECRPAYRGEPLNTKWLGGALYDGEKFALEKRENDFWSRILKRDGWTCYIHNGSGYDFHFLLEYLVRKKIPFEGFKTGDRFFCKAEGVEFFDSMALMKGSLAYMAEKLGAQNRKQTVPPDFYERITKYDWEPYLEADCLCLYETLSILKKAFSEIGCTARQTLASTAMDLFRTRFLECEIQSDFDKRREIDIRMAYVGGRTELFQHAMGHGFCLDINSCYPYAMRKPVPCEYKRFDRSKKLHDFSIAKCTIDIPPDEYAPPIHYLKHAKLFFPTGKITGFYTSEEIQYCREKYGNNSVNIAFSYLFKPRDIFSGYVDFLYKERSSKNPARSFAAKLLLTSLYGKTGMKRERKKIVFGPEWRDWPWNNEKALRMFKRYGEFFRLKTSTPFKQIYDEERGIYGIPEFSNRAPYILPQIAAFVTARGRLHLQRYLDIAGKDAVYCDTDSIFYEGKSTDIFKKEIGSKLGELKIEQEIKEGLFYAPKCYEVTDISDKKKYRAKGLRSREIENIKAFLAGKPVKIKRTPGIFESINRFGDFKLRNETQEKRNFYLDTKRHNDRPYNVEEIDRLNVARVF